MSLSKHLISGAASGNIGQLALLRDSIDSSNYVLAALDACLVHLRRDLLPDAPPSMMVYARAMSAIISLGFCILACPAQKRTVKSLSVERTFKEFDGIVAWSAYLFKYRRLAPPDFEGVDAAIAMLLVQLIDFDLARGIELVMSSTIAMDLSFKLWSSCNSEPEDPPYEWDLESGASIICLMERLLQNDRADVTFATILSSRRTLNRFCEGLVTQILWLSLRVPEPAIPDANAADIVFEDALALFHVTELAIANGAVREELQRHQYLHSWTHTLVLLENKLPHDLSYSLLFSLFDLALMGGQNGHRAWTALVESNVIPIAFDLAKDYLSKPPTEGPNASILFRHIATFDLYPRSLLASCENFEPMKKAIKGSLSSLSRDVGAAWLESTLLHDQAVDVLSREQEEELPRFCSYGQGTAVHSITEHHGLKRCSQCFSVWYCCKKCQERDWEARHRNECLQLRRSRIARLDRGVRYTPSMRDFQLGWITDLFNDKIEPNREAWRRSHYPNLLPTKIVCIYNASVDNGFSHGPNSVRIEWYLNEGYKDVVADCPVAQRKHHELMRSHRENKNQNTRLMETTIMWNHDEHVMILTEFVRRSAKWNVSRFVVRIENWAKRRELLESD